MPTTKKESLKQFKNSLERDHKNAVLKRCINCQILGFQKAAMFLADMDFGSEVQACYLVKEINEFIETHAAFKKYAKHNLHIDHSGSVVLKKRNHQSIFGHTHRFAKASPRSAKGIARHS